MLHPASAADLDAIRAVLATGDLPVNDIAQHVAGFVLAKWRSTTIGTVALEYAGDAALLRSLCVVPEHRGQALGTRLLAAIEERAAAGGVRELYLLTTSAETFFGRHGFSTSSRTAAPPRIQSTEQFRTLCPASAICMRKSLPTPSNDVTSPP